jgi:hypothetical protein
VHNLKRKIAVAARQSETPVSDTFGKQFDATKEGKRVLEEAIKEADANIAKVTPPQQNPEGIDGAIPDYTIIVTIGGDEPIETDMVMVDCKTEHGAAVVRRACYAERGDRTPQINDEIAVTGFGGTVWWSGRIFGMRKPSRKSKSPSFLVDIIYGGTKTTNPDLPLSNKTYGPAQCRVEDVRYGGENMENSYTAGWVFLVPLPQPDETIEPL